MDNIFRLIQQETGVNRDEIVGVKRDDRVLIGRILFIIYCKFYQELSYSKIGRLINRDHSSVRHLYIKYRNDDFYVSFIKKLDEWAKNGEIQQVKKKELFLSIKLHSRFNNIYTKYGGKCAVCSFDEVVEVHHIKPRRIGGSDELENLILLCPNHHALADRGLLFIKGVTNPN